jgi:hypothetical protein
MFAPSPATGALRQGEILSGVIQLHADVSTLPLEPNELAIEEKLHPHAIILTQDCDLDWDYKARREQGDENKLQLKTVPSIMFCELLPEDVLRQNLRNAGVRASKLWDRVVQNRDERYHWIPRVDAADDRAGEGLSPLVADFKRTFTIPTDEAYIRLQLGTRRRTTIEVPYLLHLSHRFGFYMSRVALPDPAEMAAPEDVQTAVAAPAETPLLGPGDSESPT